MAWYAYRTGNGVLLVNVPSGEGPCKVCELIKKGEKIPYDVEYFEGADPITVQEAIEARLAEKVLAIVLRSGTYRATEVQTTGKHIEVTIEAPTSEKIEALLARYAGMKYNLPVLCNEDCP